MPDKKDFEAIRPLKKEIEHIRRDIQGLRKPYVADTAKDYRTGFPRTIVIRGYSDSEYEKKRKCMELRLERKLEELQRRLEKLEDQLDAIEDVGMRDILRMYYRRGMTQEEIAEELNVSRKTIQRKLKTFFQDVL